MDIRANEPRYSSVTVVPLAFCVIVLRLKCGLVAARDKCEGKSIFRMPEELCLEDPDHLPHLLI